METFDTTIPYIWSRMPPKQMDVAKMLRTVAKQLNKWTETVDPKFGYYDALHLIKAEKQEDCLYLEYEIIRNKYKEEKGE